jgi:hypothetical protein
MASTSRCPGLAPFQHSSSGVRWCVGCGSWDRRSRLDEPVDDLQPLVVGGEHQDPEPALQREPAKRPAGDVTHSGGYLQAADHGSGGHQYVHDLGHAEHCCVLERGAAGDATVGCGDGLDAGPGVDEHFGDFGVAVASGGDQRGFEVSGAPVDQRARRRRPSSLVSVMGVKQVPGAG